jgi:hypothetical protein
MCCGLLLEDRMFSSRKVVSRSIMVLALTCAATTVTSSAHAASEGSTCAGVPGEGTLTLEQLPTEPLPRGCDLVGRTVIHGGLGVVIPKRGETVRVDALAVGDDSVHGFSVGVTLDGTITYDLGESDAPQVERAAAATAVAAACSDSTKAPIMHDEANRYEWYVGDGGMPGSLTREQARDAFVDAINNITGGYNDCGIRDTIDADASFAGFSTYEADISSSSTCTERDGQNTWDAGDINDGHLAVTCSWTVHVSGNNIKDLVEGDVRYNTADHGFTNNPTSSCVAHFDIRSVGTHEAGHVFGMNHVSSAHMSLTMAPGIDPCDTSDRTLGRGDMLTLEDIY